MYCSFDFSSHRLVYTKPSLMAFGRTTKYSRLTYLLTAVALLNDHSNTIYFIGIWLWLLRTV